MNLAFKLPAGWLEFFIFIIFSEEGNHQAIKLTLVV